MLSGPVAAAIAKLTGLGSLAKAAVATATAVTTVALAGGAAGLLASPAGHQDDTAAEVATNAAASTGGPGGTSAGTGAGVSAGTAGALVGSETGATVTSPPVPTVPEIPGIVDGVPDLSNVPVELPSCVTDLVGTGANTDPTRLLGQIPGCVESVLAALPGLPAIPVDVKECISSALAMATSAASTGGAVDKLDLASCLPTGSIPGLPTGSIPGLPTGAIPGLPTGAIPGLPGLPFGH